MTLDDVRRGKRERERERERCRGGGAVDKETKIKNGESRDEKKNERNKKKALVTAPCPSAWKRSCPAVSQMASCALVPSTEMRLVRYEAWIVAGCLSLKTLLT